MVFLDKELANLSVLVKRLNIYFIRINNVKFILGIIELCIFLL